MLVSSLFLSPCTPQSEVRGKKGPCLESVSALVPPLHPQWLRPSKEQDAANTEKWKGREELQVLWLGAFRSRQAGVPEDPPPSFSSSLFLTQLHGTCSNRAAFKTLLKGTPQS